MDSSIEVESRPMSHSAKLITSAAVWYCTFTLGLGVSFLGSSLLELSHKYEVDVATISKVFSVLTFFFLAGALICGVLFNYLNRQIVSSLLLIIMGIGMAAFPHAPSLLLFFTTAALVGFTGGGYDTAQIVWIIEMWANKAAPYIQTQHFAFAVGTLLSPLIIKPYLSTEEHHSDLIQTKLESNYTTEGDLSDSNLVYSTLDSGSGTSRLYTPFLIGGAASVLGGLVVLLMACIKKYDKPQKTVTTSTEGSRSSSSSTSTSRKAGLVSLSALVLGTYCGMEMCSMQFLPTFTHFIDLGLSASDGALVLSGLTGSFTVGRGIGIFIVLRVPPEILLMGNAILILLGNTLLYFFASKSYSMLWGGSISLGFGFSTVFPSFYGYIEKHLKVSNTVGAIMIMAGGAVSSVYPIIIGSFIERNPFVLMYTNYCSLLVCTSAFGMIYWSTSRDNGYIIDQERHGKGASSGEEINGSALHLKTLQG